MKSSHSTIEPMNREAKENIFINAFMTIFVNERRPAETQPSKPGRKNTKNSENTKSDENTKTTTKGFLYRLFYSCFMFPNSHHPSGGSSKKKKNKNLSPRGQIDRSAPLMANHAIYSQTPLGENTQVAQLLENMTVGNDHRRLLSSTTYEESFSSVEESFSGDTHDLTGDTNEMTGDMDERTSINIKTRSDTITTRISLETTARFIGETSSEIVTENEHYLLECHELYFRYSYQYKKSVIEGTSSLNNQTGIWMPAKLPLLPVASPADARGPRKKCLILDLDETLIHSSFHTILPEADWILSLNLSGIGGHPNEGGTPLEKVSVCKRPGTDEFLRVLSHYYELVIFTASLATVSFFFSFLFFYIL